MQPCLHLLLDRSSPASCTVGSFEAVDVQLLSKISPALMQPCLKAAAGTWKVWIRIALDSPPMTAKSAE